VNRLIGNLRDVPDRGAALENYQWLADRYDAACRPIERLRLAAIDTLALQPGETVYDVACGTGAVLSELARRVGAGGRVVGIEQSADMARAVTARFPAAALPANVELRVCPVEEARLSSPADALLFKDFRNRLTIVDTGTQAVEVTGLASDALLWRDANGKRPVFSHHPHMQNDPHFRDHVLFYEYFHGDTGRGVGAAHQTGWTGLVAKLLQPRGR